MANAAVNWYSKRQNIVALSSTESEYIALSQVTREAIWLRGLINELNQMKTPTIKIYVDNQSTIKLAENGNYSQRTKHIDIQFHHIKEQIENGTINIEYIPTEENCADALTKPMTIEKQRKCSDLYGLCQ